MNNTKTFILKANKKPITIIFLSIVLAVLVFKFDNVSSIVELSDPKLDEIIDIALIWLIIGLLSSYLLWLLTGKIVIKISKDKLTVVKKVIGIGFKKSYDLNEICNIEILKDVKGSAYTSFGGLIVRDINTKVLKLCYKWKDIYIGRGCADFNADQIVKTIQEFKNIR